MHLMAGKGFEIGIGVDTKAAKQAIDAGLVEPLENASEELTNLGKNRGPEQLEKGLRDAQEQTERLEQETKQTADAIDKGYRDAYRKVKQSADDGMGSASEATESFATTAQSKVSEFAASFDGDMSSIGNLAQSTLGGLANALPGPLAFAAGAAAIGAGIIGGIADGINQSRAEIEKEIADAVKSAVMAGEEAITAEGVKERFIEMYTDDDGTLRAQAQKLAEEIGTSMDEVLWAMAGDQSAIDRVRGLVDAVREELGPEKLGTTAGHLRISFERMFDPIEAKIGVIDDIRRRADLLYDALNVHDRETRDDHAALRQEVAQPLKTTLEVDFSTAEQRLRTFTDQQRLLTIKTRVMDQYGRTY